MQAPLESDLVPSQAVREFVRRASEAPLPAPDDELRLVEAASSGDDGALDELVRGHLRMVVDEAIRYRGVGQRTRDLIPDGVEALVSAARAYEPRADESFGSYARSCIRHAMGLRFGPH